MYNRLNTYYTPDAVPIDTGTGLIKADYVNTLEGRLDRNTRPHIINNPYAEMPGFLHLTVPMIIVGLFIRTIDDPVSKVGGSLATILGALIICYDFLNTARKEQGYQ